MNDQDDIFARALSGLMAAKDVPAGTITLDHAEVLQGVAPGGPWLVYIAHQPERRFVSLSSGWRSALGWPRRILISRPYLDFVHPDDVKRTAALLEPGKTLVVPRDQVFTNRYICRAGCYQEIRWNGISVDMGNGLLLGTASMGERIAGGPLAQAHVTRIESDES